MPLFLVQDDDRPMYVLAEDWTAALTEWRDKIADENGIDGDKENPLGVQLICEDGDILIERKLRRTIYQRQADNRWEAANKRDSQPPETGINDPPINSPIKCPNCESMSYYSDGHHELVCSVCQYIAPSPK